MSNRHRRAQLRIASDVVGPRGLAVLVLTGALAGGLAVVGASAQGVSSLSTSLATTAGSSASSSGSPGSAKGSPGTTAPSHPSPSSSGGASSSSKGTSSSSGGTSSASPPTTTKPGPLLSSTPYAQYAFLLYPGTPSASTRQALAGFKIQVQHQGTSIVVSATVVNSSQPAVRSRYPATDKVYFVEANLGDESGNTDYNLGDDGLVVTDAQGRVVA